MANQSKLKAWLRYDGTGRVVTAGPIFQANKPKVGNWRQMNIDLCCNSNGTTTTTTTGGSNPQPTAFVTQYWSNSIIPCTGIMPGSLLFYSASSTLAEGISVFSDAALTTPLPDEYVIFSFGGMQNVYYVVVNGVLVNYSCINTTMYFNADQQVACSYNTSSQNIAVNNSSGMLLQGSTVYANFGGFGYNVGQTIYLAGNIYASSPGYITVTVTSPTTATIVVGTQACVIVNSQTFYMGGDIGSACGGTTQQVLYFTGSFQNGSAVYTDPSLTTPAPFGFIVDPTSGNIFQTVNGLAFYNGNCNG